MQFVFYCPQSLVVSRGSEGVEKVTQLSGRTAMTSNSKSINNQNSAWKEFHPPIFCLTDLMGGGEVVEKRKARHSGGGTICFSSGELSIIRPLFGLVNGSRSHKKEPSHCSRLFMWGLSGIFPPVLAHFWTNFVSSEEKENLLLSGKTVTVTSYKMAWWSVLNEAR